MLTAPSDAVNMRKECEVDYENYGVVRENFSANVLIIYKFHSFSLKFA